MALAWVQDSAAVVLSAPAPTNQTATLTFGSNVTAGNTLVVYVALHNVATRTFTVSDNVDGAWTGGEIVSTNPYLGAALFWKANHTGGAVTITVTHGLASSSFYAGASEFSGFGTTPVEDASDSLAESVATDNHTCSASGITSANECIAVCACVLNSIVTSTAAGSGYTEHTDGSTGGTRILFQWQRFASGTSAHTGPWTSVGTDRTGTSVIALLSGTAGAPPATSMPVIASIYRRRFES